MIVGAFEGERPQHRLEAFRAAASVARRLAARAWPMRWALIREVSVEPLLEHPRGHLQGVLPQGSLQGCQLPLRGAAYERLDLATGGRREVRREPFFSAPASAVVSVSCNSASAHCSQALQ